MDQIEEIKTKIDIVELVGSYVNLKQAGRNFKGLCPFHQEKTPSFMVNPELQIYKCFGCGKGGDAISFIQEVEGVEFREALEMLAEKAGVVLKFGRKQEGGVRDQLLAVNEAAAEYYHFLLSKHQVGGEARKYLSGRGLNEKVIESFRLGYALPMWDGLVKYLVGKKGYKIDLLEQAGLVVKTGENKAYDRFRDRVVFPLIDHRGRVVGLAGRVMPGADEKAGAKYINSPETEVYHKSEMLYGFYQAKQAIREKDRVVLVEGEMDMISSFVAGVGETVAVKGTALTEGQIRLIRRMTRNLILALDADGAGQAATRRSIELAEKEGMYVRVVKVSGGKDPDDVAREKPGEWRKMVERAVDVYDYYIESAVERYGGVQAQDKRRMSEEVVPVLARIENEVMRMHYAKKLARVLEVETEVVLSEMSRVGRMSVVRGENMSEDVSEVKDRGSGMERQILALLLRLDKEKGEGVLEEVGDLMEDGLQRVVKEWFGAKKGVVEFIKSLPAELRGLAEEAYIQEVDEERAERDLREVVEQWRKKRWREVMESLRKELVEAEEKGDDERVAKLRDKVVRLSKKIAKV